MSSVRRSIASGAAWMVLLKAVERLLGVLSTIILARLLMPEDFGMIAMAMSFVAILDLLWSFSFDAALIQNQQADRAHYDTAWTLNVMLGVFIALGLLGLAYPAAWFYEDPRLVPLISCLAVGSLMQGLENIGVVAFRKDLRFGMEFAYQASRKFAGFLVTIPLAFILRNYWALAAGMVTGRAAALVISYWAHPYRPRFCLEARDALVNFSKWLFLNNLLFSIQMRAQDFVIGKVSGPKGLGLYNVAYEIATLPTTGIVFPINRAVFPGFSRLAQEPGALLRGYLDVVALIAVLVLPAGLGIAATAELLIPVFLGEKWLNAIPVVQVLAFYGTLAALSSVFSPTFLALGRPRMLSVFTVINVALFVPAVIYGTLTADVIGAAWGCLAVVSVMMPASHWMAARAFGVGIGRVVQALWRPTVAAIAMFLAVHAVVAAMGPATGSVEAMPKLAAAIGLGVAVYPLALWALWILSGRPEGAETVVLREVAARLARRRAARASG